MFFNNKNNFFGNFMGQQNCCGNQNNCSGDPIIEQPIERCVERNICHKVEHICPIHTRIINNHIYEHTYRPEYTCSEENVVTNMDPGCCANQNF